MKSIFGDGSDGNIRLDGNDVIGFLRFGKVYVPAWPIQAQKIRLSRGVSLVMANHSVHAKRLVDMRRAGAALRDWKPPYEKISEAYLLAHSYGGDSPNTNAPTE